MKKKILPISIVCATHKGQKKLPILINSIYNNTYWPTEVIICGTKKSDFKFISISKFNNLNIKKIVSKIKNQKSQRNLAIKNTKSDIIAQCDDDLELDKDYLKQSFKHFSNKKKIKKIVSAAILFKNLKHQAIRWNSAYYSFKIYRLILLTFNHFKKLRFMSILDSGRIIPLLPKDFLTINKSQKILQNLQWVCSTIIYHKSALNDAYNYLPVTGEKAYYEDVFFSHSLYKKKYNLMIDRSIIAYHPPTEKTDINVFLKTVGSQKKIVKQFKKSFVLFYLDVSLFTLIFMLLKLFKKQK
tara:strand:- start:1502 stop:2398 length:897 start_codon:yes stop_codon:yes gene_type:complete